MHVFMAEIYDVVFAISQPLPPAFGSLRSIVVRIIARHAIDGGSIPPGDIFFFLISFPVRNHHRSFSDFSEFFDHISSLHVSTSCTPNQLVCEVVVPMDAPPSGTVINSQISI